ncbi:hypothetical protein BSPWISOX_2677 [uncultured Gammaproteobacteria bacterium]|nr:hypothetical protein [uncultured Gammaproteobacteria bacterium]VVH61533.1 hypothetical protein BSPWISOX_2677 [uncultured Gammaproteobacteria bacterium]
MAFGYFNERVESYFYDKRVASHFLLIQKRLSGLVLKVE